VRMTGITIAIGALIVGVAYLIWTQHRSQNDGDPRLKAELERKVEESGELKNQIAEMKSEKDELAGKGKQLYDSFKNLEADQKALTKERDTLSSQLSKKEAVEEQRIKKHEEMISQLESAKKTLEDERQRVRHEDEERQQHEAEERDRLWTEHENSVVSLLTDLCKKPQYAFSSYDNTNLPDGFHGSIKPDFLIEFLGQYVIFDAKVSKASSLQTYITDQVKRTASKVKGKKDIYPVVFLVIPTHAIEELKKLSYYEDSYSFFVVSPESLEPILASLKRIENYEFAKEMDPQQRENIVDLIAQFDFHISTRTAVDYHLLEHGLETLAKARDMDGDLYKDVVMKRKKMRNLNFNTADVKQMTANPQIVHQKLLELTDPKPLISQEELEHVKE